MPPKHLSRLNCNPDYIFFNADESVSYFCKLLHSFSTRKETGLVVHIITSSVVNLEAIQTIRYAIMDSNVCILADSVFFLGF